MPEGCNLPPCCAHTAKCMPATVVHHPPASIPPKHCPQPGRSDHQFMIAIRFPPLVRFPSDSTQRQHPHACCCECSAASPLTDACAPILSRCLSLPGPSCPCTPPAGHATLPRRCNPCLRCSYLHCHTFLPPRLTGAECPRPLSINHPLCCCGPLPPTCCTCAASGPPRVEQACTPPCA